MKHSFLIKCLETCYMFNSPLDGLPDPAPRTTSLGVRGCSQYDGLFFSTTARLHHTRTATALSLGSVPAGSELG